MPCSFIRRLALSMLAIALMNPAQPGVAIGQTESVRPVCDKQQALLLIQQQVDESKKLDDAVARISILKSAADLLWPHQQDAAREVFAQAYEHAENHFREKGDETKRDGRLHIQLPDQRFEVLKAIARRDPAWARSLTERITEEARREAERADREARLDPRSRAKSTVNNPDAAEKILYMAESMLNTDQRAAISIAGSSFTYPSTSGLPSFIIKLAELNQHAADQFYREAIRAYADAPIDQLLYLSAYPFGLNRLAAPEAFSIYFPVPQNFVPNPGLQQMFLETLFRRAEASVKSQDPTIIGPYRITETAHIYIALNRLEPLIAQNLPGYLERATWLKAMMGAHLSSDAQQQVAGVLKQMEFRESGSQFESQLESAERENNPGRRDQLWAFAILGAPDTESTERLQDVAQKISDVKVRSQVLNWLYFKRTQKAVKEGLLDEARRLAEKVEQLDQRAYLHYEIASAALKQLEDKARASEALNEVAAAANKAWDTNEKARTLLGVVHLYARFDQIRAFEVMKDAVKTINAIAEPDLTGNMIIQRIEGATLSHYSSYHLDGFSLGNSFRELGPYDFDGALLLARSLDNQTLRSLTILALSASCLDSLEKLEKKQKREKSVKPGTSRKP